MDKIPKDVQAICEQLAKGYERRRKDYQNRRNDIIYSGGVSYADMVGGSRGNGTTDTVASKTERLENLEACIDVKLMRAVEQSLSATGADVPRNLRERLHKAIMLNVESGKDYPYELLNIDEFSRSEFYRRRKGFVRGIGVELGLWG